MAGALPPCHWHDKSMVLGRARTSAFTHARSPAHPPSHARPAVRCKTARARHSCSRTGGLPCCFDSSVDAKRLLQACGILVDYLAAELSIEDASLGSKFHEMLGLGNIEAAAAMLTAGLVWVRTKRLRQKASEGERPNAVSSEGEHLISLAHEELLRCCESQASSQPPVGGSALAEKEDVATTPSRRGLNGEKELVYVLCDWVPEEDARNKMRVHRGQRILVSLSTERGWSYGEILAAGVCTFYQKHAHLEDTLKPHHTLLQISISMRTFRHQNAR